MTYLYIIAFVVLWMQIKPNHKLFKRKPFSCELCMAFWITLIYEIAFNYEYGNAFIIALVTPIAYNIYNKLLIFTLK